ncbi:MAG: hypothetical protein ABI671_14200 [Burkholderiales bacterium]
MNEAALALADARRSAMALPALPPGAVASDLSGAYALQRAVAASFGTVRGWKVSGLNTAQQHAMGVPRPVGGPLLEPWFHTAPATFALSAFIAPRLECELAFELARDLPERDTPYTRAEVAAAISALRIGVEVTDSRLPPASPFLAELADGFNNGAYVVGPACADWQHIDFASHSIALATATRVATIELARGSGQPVLDGDPFGAVVLLANAQPPGYGGLRAGQIVTTGTCTGAVAVPGRCTVDADFGTLGRITLTFE